MMVTMVRKAADQESGEPSGVPAQSYARMRAPISPPPASQSKPVLCAPVVSADREESDSAIGQPSDVVKPGTSAGMSCLYTRKRKGFK
jgi:hypothetical protein